MVVTFLRFRHSTLVPRLVECPLCCKREYRQQQQRIACATMCCHVTEDFTSRCLPPQLPIASAAHGKHAPMSSIRLFHPRGKRLPNKGALRTFASSCWLICLCVCLFACLFGQPQWCGVHRVQRARVKALNDPNTLTHSHTHTLTHEYGLAYDAR